MGSLQWIRRMCKPGGERIVHNGLRDLLASDRAVVGLVPILGQLTQGAAFSRKNKDFFVCFQRAQLRKNCSALDR